MPEERFDRITRLLARVFDVPIALLSLVDATRLWLKSRHGIDRPELQRKDSFCEYTIAAGETFVVEDVSTDDRFVINELVEGAPNVRFYAGHPLHGPDGARIGALCLLDTRARRFSDDDAAKLRGFAELIDHELSRRTGPGNDSLTGIANRRGFLQTAVPVLALCKRNQQPATIINIDLDDFRSINDTFGHEAGDRLLERFAGLLVKNFRHSDVVAHFGGDEFCVLTSYTTVAMIETSVRRLDEAITSSSISLEHPMLSWSTGVAEYDPSQPPNIDQLLAEARNDMLAAKRAATKRVAVGGRAGI
jgi:diguanylate cyclase (GGDEF)-like protein